ncbi:protealysin inhibitor emfourin [Streptomyces polygonati]|uniref:Protealysin inhibitor emfourin n=1 Tax=Streptomyces polygonati TaxID=1617087 RepID=A0ABV8HU12_9ACTN
MRIEVVRTGGFAGIPRTATLDTATHPDGPHLAALADKILAAPSSRHPTVPDGFTYTITAGPHTIRCADPHLTPAQRELIEAALGEGA